MPPNFGDESKPVAQQRVTKEEIAHAIASIEAKKQEMEDRNGATLPIGQAVDELSLDLTADEIWAQVLAQRETQTEGETPQNPAAGASPLSITDRRRILHTISQLANGPATNRTSQLQGVQGVFSSPDARFWLTMGLVFLTGLIIFHYVSLRRSLANNSSWNMNHVNQASNSSHIDPLSRVTQTVDAAFYQKLRLCQGPNPQYHLLYVNPFLNIGNIDPTETVYPIRAVPDGYSIYDDPKSDYPIEMGPASGVVFRPAAMTSLSSPITNMPTTRYDGARYVRCYIPSAEVPALLKHQSVTFYFSRTIPGVDTNTVLRPITIRLFRFSRGQLVRNFWPPTTVAVYSDSDSLTEPDGQHIVLDSHAWENYATMTLPAYTPPAWAMMRCVFNDVPAPPMQPQDITTISEYHEFDASSQLRYFSQIPNDQIFWGSHDTLMSLKAMGSTSEGSSYVMSQRLFDIRPLVNQPYTFIKHNGHPYLLGWVANRDLLNWVTNRLTPEEAANFTLTIADSPDSPLFLHPPVPIQIRMDTTNLEPDHLRQNSSVTPEDAENLLQASDVHLDQYTWQKWSIKAKAPRIQEN